MVSVILSFLTFGLKKSWNKSEVNKGAEIVG